MGTTITTAGADKGKYTFTGTAFATMFPEGVMWASFNQFIFDLLEDKYV